MSKVGHLLSAILTLSCLLFLPAAWAREEPPAPAPIYVRDPLYTVSGRSEPGTRVTLTRNGEEVHTLTVGPEGTFTFPPVRLREGENTLLVTATDPAGQVTQAVRRVVLDSIPPPLTLAVPLTKPEVPPLRLETLPILGETEPEATVTVTLNGQALPPQQAGADGVFRFRAVPLQEGRNELIIAVSDALGNTRTATRMVVRDTTPPSVTWAAAATEPRLPPTRQETVTLSGHTEPHAQVTVVHNGHSRTVRADTRGSFQIALGPLREGLNEFEIRFSDALGNTLTFTRSVMRDTKPPGVVLTPPLDTEQTWSTTTPTLTVTGLTEPGARVVLRRGGTVIGETTAEPGGRFQFATVPLQEGLNTFTLTLRDALGNVHSLTRTVLLDTQPPPLRLRTEVPKRVRHTTLRLLGETEPGAVVQLTDPTGQVRQTTGSEEGTFEFTLALREGDNRFSLRASDALGNVQTASYQVTLDTQSPFLDLDAPFNAGEVRLTAARVKVSGRSEPGARLRCWVNNRLVGVLSPLRGETFTFPQVPLTEGGNRLVVTAADAIGNTRRLQCFILRDRTPPWLQVTRPVPAGILETKTLTLRGRAEPDCQVTLTLDTGAKQETQADSTGQFEFPAVSLHDGTNEFQITATDAAGNRRTVRFQQAARVSPPLLRILSPTGPVLTAPRLAVRVECEQGARLTVWVNGQKLGPPLPAQAVPPAGEILPSPTTVSARREPREVGKSRSSAPASGSSSTFGMRGTGRGVPTEQWVFPAVAFRLGPNLIVAEAISASGKRRARTELPLHRPGPTYTLHLAVEPKGAGEMLLRVRAHDRWAQPVQDGTLITLWVPAGVSPAGQDASEQPGWQVATAGGVAEVLLHVTEGLQRPVVTAQVAAYGESIVISH